MKRLISLLLSLAMVLSLMPVSIGASAEENMAEEEKVLFAAWSDFSGYLYDFPELPVNMMTNLLFCLGSGAEGFAQLHLLLLAFDLLQLDGIGNRTDQEGHDQTVEK